MEKKVRGDWRISEKDSERGRKSEDGKGGEAG